MTPSEYKILKGLDKENLRDHMTDLELIFTMLGEASTSEIEKVKGPNTFEEHKKASRGGGSVAKTARLNLERKTKRKVISVMGLIPRSSAPDDIKGELLDTT